MICICLCQNEFLSYENVSRIYFADGSFTVTVQSKNAFYVSKSIGLK